MIYAPIIDSEIPAFYESTLVVPYRMNPAVSFEDFSSMQVDILDSFGTTQKGSKTTTKFSIKSDKGYEAIFEGIGNLTPGTFYKIRLGYVDGKQAETFSSLATVKYTEKPTLSVTIKDNSMINIKYSNKDKTERMGTYVVIDSEHPEDMVEGVYNNDSLRPQDGTDIELLWSPYSAKNGKIKVIGTTLNKLKVEEEVDKISLTGATLEEDNIKIDEANGFISFKNVGGNFVSRENEIINTSISAKFTDFTFVSGETVEYNFGNNTIAKITPYFEDSFLSDNEHQLCIRFDPKISSYKEVIQEAKTDTLGSKFPYISRNSLTGYKELPISGLISYLQDPEQLFISWEDLGITEGSIELTKENIAAERKFKNEVMNWLNNGKPKLLRTPTEGNFIVRLMNVSLAPNDTLGRMLHTFSATAYEIAEFNGLNLRKYNLNRGDTYNDNL